ncbi:MAG: site-specific integrase [Bacteroidales bacterium]|nr:site-specific integrase [Bacteroidales bacterium]
MPIKRHEQFIPDTEKGNAADGKLRYRIRWGRNIVNFNLGYRVEFKKWSYDTQRCKNGTTHGKRKISAAIINRAINKFERATEHVFNSFEIKGKMPDLPSFRAEFNKCIGRTKTVPQIAPDNFFGIWDEFQKTMGNKNNWTVATYAKFRSILRHIKEYDRNTSIDDIDDNYLQGFVSHQLTVPLRNSTIQKNLSFVRWFLRWAYNNDYYKGKSHETFRPRLKGATGNVRTVVYLTWQELQHLYSFRFSRQCLEQVRDVFCFCCFTGLRYSDVKKLRKTDIRDKYFDVVTQKTAEALRIEFNNFSKTIINKYWNEPLKNDCALPVISNAKMNLFLKDMARIAGIDSPQRMVYFTGSTRHEDVYPKWQLITTHCGRRTFIVNALYLGISAEVVMKWTGHADYKAMKPYIEIVDSLKEREMMKFNSFIPD